MQLYRPKFRHHHTHQVQRNMLREVEIRNSSPPLSKPYPPQNSEVQPFPLLVLPRPNIPVGGRLAHFVEQWEELTDNKWVLSSSQMGSSSHSSQFLPIGHFDKLESIFLPVIERRDHKLLKKRAVERVRNLGTPSFYSRLFLVPIKNRKLCPVIQLSFLNLYINKAF